MPRPILARVDVNAMAHNLAIVRQNLREATVPGACIPLIWAVVKANAYGHGIENAVWGFAAADGLAMLDFEEAERCRAAGWQKPILMLEGAFEPADVLVASRLGLTLVLHDAHQLRLLSAAKVDRPLDIYLKLNTGMNRLGFGAANYAGIHHTLQGLQATGQVGQIVHMTHFACADQPDGIDEPLALFMGTVGDLPGDWSVANSAAILRHGVRLARAAGQTQVWVRPGICLYGAAPSAELPVHQQGFQQTMTLSSTLISVHPVAAGEGIGYGYLSRAARNGQVGVVACGYADGYPRHAPVGTPVTVRGCRVPLLGRVSMDMIVIDVSTLTGVAPGDEVILWGQGGPSVDEIAALAGTIGYELLAAVTARVPRQTNSLRP